MDPNQISKLKRSIEAGQAAEDELLGLLRKQLDEAPSEGSGNDEEAAGARAAAEDEMAKLLLVRIQRGSRAVKDELFKYVRGEMRDKAGRLIPRNDRTLQPTALVADTFLDLLDNTKISWNDRKHFIAFASLRMKQLFIDYVRHRQIVKKHKHVNIDGVDITTVAKGIDMETRLRVLKILRDDDLECYEVVLLRLYAELTVENAAKLIGVHPNTIKNKFKTALSILKAELASGIDS